MLEPSLAAFSLDEKKDSAGRRYVGNSFGIPHRDYAHPELFPCPRRAEGRWELVNHPEGSFSAVLKPIFAIDVAASKPRYYAKLHEEQFVCWLPGK